MGLGSVLGYLCAGLIVGPFGFKFFTDSYSILHVAELGVVLFLFIIGLEMKPSHLWSLRREIFVLGSAQIALCTVVLTSLSYFIGFSPLSALIGNAGFVLTSQPL